MSTALRESPQRNGTPVDKPSLADARPFNDFCLVKLHQPRVTEGGIKLPDKSETYKIGVWQVGEVLRVGPGELTIDGHRKALTVKPGDRVLFDIRQAQIPNSLDVISVDGEYQFLFVREQNMLAAVASAATAGPTDGQRSARPGSWRAESPTE